MELPRLSGRKQVYRPCSVIPCLILPCHAMPQKNQTNQTHKEIDSQRKQSSQGPDLPAFSNFLLTCITASSLMPCLIIPCLAMPWRIRWIRHTNTQTAISDSSCVPLLKCSTTGDYSVFWCARSYRWPLIFILKINDSIFHWFILRISGSILHIRIYAHPYDIAHRRIKESPVEEHFKTEHTKK